MKGQLYILKHYHVYERNTPNTKQYLLYNFCLSSCYLKHSYMITAVQLNQNDDNDGDDDNNNLI
jgi:hypothetical protein